MNDRHLVLEFGGSEWLLDASGLAIHPAEKIAVVADLHLEKGSAFARRGTMLPPYDSLATLERLTAILRQYRPRRVISLGDGFHDTTGARLFTGGSADMLLDLTRCYDWLWLKGNHDHELPKALPGERLERLTIANIDLQHEPQSGIRPSMVGHLHPKARVKNRRRSMSRPCFAWNCDLMILPAFGSYTGGLNVLEPAIAAWLPAPTVGLLGEARLFAVDFKHLCAEPGSMGHIRRLA